jgi:hypothetical protein
MIHTEDKLDELLSIPSLAPASLTNRNWLFEEQLFIDGGKYRFSIEEYTDTIDMSKEELQEWEEGLGPLWDSLNTGIAFLPNLITEVQSMRKIFNAGRWDDSSFRDAINEIAWGDMTDREPFDDEETIAKLHEYSLKAYGFDRPTPEVRTHIQTKLKEEDLQ